MGLTTPKNAPPHNQKVHPHARGAYLTVTTVYVRASGSSPRTWGLRRKDARGQLHCGFIPTHVGLTRAISRPSSCWIGSSPRTWGLRLDIQYALATDRFIPTHVGLTYVRTPDEIERFGSSPRTWGLRPGGPRPLRKLRFIPTHVGLTGLRPGTRLGEVVHPHARGAYENARYQHHTSIGSSPRTWGLPVQSGFVITALRFIPTHVGLTVEVRQQFVPTVRFIPTHVGLTAGLGGWNCRHSGSSPRTWGLLPIPPAPPPPPRFIPTHVGLTLKRN